MEYSNLTPDQVVSEVVEFHIEVIGISYMIVNFFYI